ncbi:hypothetical protein A0H81_04080 [Grifola frondosa]|uniref:Cupredoxin n=1 Tax=Grifola frondosa TaxID=5627 RepID=A0A1C7MG09_GRIFR|nr:hypothetical protein A0H81_04080 [Grifola frondosa]
MSTFSISASDVSRKALVIWVLSVDGGSMSVITDDSTKHVAKPTIASALKQSTSRSRFKMRFSTIVAALLPVGFALAQNVTIVKVGANGTLAYDPPQVTANPGDTIAFQFLAKNHTVTQSTFADPCSNLTNADGSTGIDSGFQFVPTSATSFPQWSFTLSANTTGPLWFYCRQTGHCAQGMVFAVNPTAAKSFDAFQAAAKALAANTTSTASGSSTSASGTSSTGTTAGSAGTSSAGTASTPSPSASTTSNTTNGAGVIRAGGSAALLAAAGLAAGLFL